MAASDARPVCRKNAAFRFYFAIRKPSDSTLITTWAGADSEVSLDGASYSDCTNEATEIGTTGTGYIDLTAAEMNADAVLLKVTVTNTGAVPLVFTLFPEEAGDYRVDSVAQTGDSYAIVNSGTHGNAALKTLIDAIDNFIDTEVAAIIAAIGSPSNLGSGATLAGNLVDIEAQTDDIGTAGAGLTAIPWNAAWDTEVQSEVADALTAYAPATPAQVNAEVLDVLNVDTFAEVGQEAPAATNSIRKMVAYLFKAWRNRSTQTATAYNLYADDAATVDQKATVADDGTTFTRSEVETGP